MVISAEPIFWELFEGDIVTYPAMLGLSQDLEPGCPKLAIVKFWGVNFFKPNKGDHNILKFQP